MTDKKPAKVGRPTRYTKVMGEEICTRLADGESLRSICRDDHIANRANVFRWLLSDSDIYSRFRDQYALAREIQSECLIDDIFDISDDGGNDWMERNDPSNPGYDLNGESLGRSRLRVDTRKWYAGKVITRFRDKPDLNPGDDSPIQKIQIEVVGANGNA